ncbi:MAG TPA: putative nucleotide-diphospho-sugar transferase [Parafilimonas sp.]|nr:putative nucleotide-diphospho-sugar transferase [Parafilimonas sp.]
MQLEKIISLANNKTRLRLLAMIRSLRASGCNLPVWIIPFDNDRFELPVNCAWWENKNITGWLDANHAHKVMRKYQCLLESNYQFVDSDVIFLKNPENILNDFSGFVTSCGHWHNPDHTTTKEVLEYFNKRTTIWQQKVFNSGQFACDKALYDFDNLKQTAELPAYKSTCVDFKYHEQPGVNLLVNLTGIPVTNITLQPYYMESTWAGDYTDENYERFWKNEQHKPYIIHWAGCDMNINRPIDELFLAFLTKNEKEEWHKKVLETGAIKNSFNKKLKRKLSKIKTAVRSLSE